MPTGTTNSEMADSEMIFHADGRSYVADMSAPVAHGAFGEVYIGYEFNPETKTKNLDKKVAVKIIPQVGEKQPERTKKEFEISKAQQVYLGGEAHTHHTQIGNTSIIISPFIEGGDLLQAYHSRKTQQALPMLWRIDLIIQLLMQIDSMHHNRAWGSDAIVHRDIKPENIMADPENQRITLIDFGLADYQDPLGNTTDNRACGTQGYFAPEIKSRTASSKADIYSLASSIQMLLGATIQFTQHPFSATNNSYLNKFEWLNPKKRRDLEGLINNMLSPSPEERPAADRLLKFFLEMRTAYFDAISKEIETSTTDLTSLLENESRLTIFIEFHGFEPSHDQAAFVHVIFSKAYPNYYQELLAKTALELGEIQNSLKDTDLARSIKMGLVDKALRVQEIKVNHLIHCLRRNLLETYYPILQEDSATPHWKQLIETEIDALLLNLKGTLKKKSIIELRNIDPFSDTYKKPIIKRITLFCIQEIRTTDYNTLIYLTEESKTLPKNQKILAAAAWAEKRKRFYGINQLIQNEKLDVLCNKDSFKNKMAGILNTVNTNEILQKLYEQAIKNRIEPLINFIYGNIKKGNAKKVSNPFYCNLIKAKKTLSLKSYSECEDLLSKKEQASQQLSKEHCLPEEVITLLLQAELLSRFRDDYLSKVSGCFRKYRAAFFRAPFERALFNPSLTYHGLFALSRCLPVEKKNELEERLTHLRAAA